MTTTTRLQHPQCPLAQGLQEAGWGSEEQVLPCLAHGSEPRSQYLPLGNIQRMTGSGLVFKKHSLSFHAPEDSQQGA